jgi:hypothetical protein
MNKEADTLYDAVKIDYELGGEDIRRPLTSQI